MIQCVQKERVNEINRRPDCDFFSSSSSALKMDKKKQEIKSRLNGSKRKGISEWLKDRKDIIK